MQKSLYPLFLLLCLSIVSIVIYTYKYYFSRAPPYHSPDDKIKICEKANITHSQLPNYRGKSLISNADDPEDIVLCPGDAFGDLNETYVLFQDCNLTMYHKDKILWSPKINTDWESSYKDEELGCALSLERNGNLVMHKEEWFVPDLETRSKFADFRWDSQTNSDPVKTELKLKDQQVQIVHTFNDGTQKLFFADEDHQEFHEDMGEPLKIDDKLIIKSHQDEDKTILRRNEYIGDINGTHLILQTNCELQLRNKTKTIWSFSPSRHEMNCTLIVAGDHTIEMLTIGANNHNERTVYYRESLMIHPEPLEVIESQITFKDDQPMITQTLKNGSKLVFFNRPGQNIGLSLKRDLTQIALKDITLRNDENNEGAFIINRMDYIGNLTGLHLLLEQNCSLVLANGDEKLWEFRTEPQRFEGTLLECSVQLEPNGKVLLKREFGRGYQESQSLFGHRSAFWENNEFITGVQLTLENDQVLIKREHKYPGPDIFYAGPKTNGSFFQFIAERSVIINALSYHHEILPKTGYIGDLDGVYTILDQRCNWVLYNRTQILWESGRSLDDDWKECALFGSKYGEIRISASREEYCIWSALNSSSRVPRMELSVYNGELWLIQTLTDGSVYKYQAIKATNDFALVSRNEEKFISLDL